MCLSVFHTIHFQIDRQRHRGRERGFSRAHVINMYVRGYKLAYCILIGFVYHSLSRDSSIKQYFIRGRCKPRTKKSDKHKKRWRKLKFTKNTSKMSFFCLFCGENFPSKFNFESSANRTKSHSNILHRTRLNSGIEKPFNIYI